jgi:lipopolysaccharide transport system ATP-binding protein
MCAYAIKATGISKSYYLGAQKSFSLKRDLQRWATNFGKHRKEEEEYLFWALQDINFTIDQGEVVAFIGNNGAGKSTLLKIISNVIAPTSGIIEGIGSIASLLEVGTGFHPELTGRENVYLNGHLLGMNKREIDQQFDAIVDFAGIGNFIDTPVKKYSSGMYVRLAFAIAAHVEPDILIVDEVLAVGDTAFQQKCMERIKQISSKNGRTVILVSHNMTVIEQLCKKVFWLDKGRLIETGAASEVVNKYLSISNDIVTHKVFTDNAPGNDCLRLQEIRVNSKAPNATVVDNQPVHIYCKVIEKAHFNKPFRFRFMLLDAKWNCLIDNYAALISSKNSHYNIDIELPANLFQSGFYYVYLSAIAEDGTVVTDFERVVEYYLAASDSAIHLDMPATWGLIKPSFPFTVNTSSL